MTIIVMEAILRGMRWKMEVFDSLVIYISEGP